MAPLEQGLLAPGAVAVFPNRATGQARKHINVVSRTAVRGERPFFLPVEYGWGSISRLLG
jgi:DNA-binding sugar fermentation-stimulating protein